MAWDFFRNARNTGGRVLLAAMLLVMTWGSLQTPASAQGTSATAEVNVNINDAPDDTIIDPVAPEPTPTPTATFAPPPPPVATLAPPPTEVPPTAVIATVEPIATSEPVPTAPPPTEPTFVIEPAATSTMVPAVTEPPTEDSAAPSNASGELEATSTVTPTEAPTLTEIFPLATATEPAPATATSTVEPTIEPTSTSESTETSTATMEPTAETTAVISYQLQPEITCQPAGNAVSDDTQEYTCTLSGDILATDAANLDLSLNWFFTAITSDGWTVELADATGQWTTAATSTSISPQQSIATGENTSLSRHVDLTVNVRLHQTRCSTTGNVALAASLDVTTGGSEDALISSASDRATGTIAVIGDNTAEPSLAFTGPLTFAEVNPQGSGMESQTTGSLTLVASALTSACGDWSVTLIGSPLTASTGDVIPAGNLVLTSINGQAVAEGACSLNGACLLATIPAGEAVPDVQTFHLEFTLTIPAGTLAGSFGSSISASIDPA